MMKKNSHQKRNNDNNEGDRRQGKKEMLDKKNEETSSEDAAWTKTPGQGEKSRTESATHVGSGAEGQDRAAVLSRDGKVDVSYSWKVPDGGWGWVVVMSSMVVGLIVDGVSYTFGLFLGEFERAFQAPKSTVALASSLQVGVYLFVGPIVSVLTNRFGCRKVIVAGSFIAGLAFIASSWSTGPTMLILTYGVVGGIGFGLMFLPSIVAVSIYFEERRAVATGIAVCGSGIGTFILAPLTDYLLSEYNWRWTLLLLAGLVLQGMVVGSLVRPLDLQPTVKDNNNVQDKERDEVLKRSDKMSRDEGSHGFKQGTIGRGTVDERATGRPVQELVPLISVTDERRRSPALLTANKQEKLLFSSAPDMHTRSNSRLNRTVTERDTDNPSKVIITPKWTPRRRTQSTSDRDVVSQPRHPRAHAPVGLGLISLSDAQLNKIRDEVQLPLSRKDIHLSGPLALTEADTRLRAGERQGRGLYIHSIKSITSLADKEALQDVSGTSRGLWSCLPESARDTLEEMLDLSILKDIRYWYVLLGNFTCMIGFYVPFVYIPDRAKQIGISEDNAAFLISIIGITNTLGRVLAGVFINFLNLDSVAVTSGALLLAGIVTAVCPVCLTYPSLAAVSAIFGICVAAYISLCSVLLCELFGVENLTNAFGFVILFRGVACIIGPPLAGAIIDATGVFDPSFYVGGGMIVLGALSHAILLLPCSRRKKV